MTPTMPSDSEAIAALHVLRAWLGIVGTTAPAAYSADVLPPGVTRDAYLRRHRARVRDAVPGWSRSGHGRTVTRQAWETDVEAETMRTRGRRRTPPALAIVPPAAPSLDEAMDRRLGIRVRGSR